MRGHVILCDSQPLWLAPCDIYSDGDVALMERLLENERRVGRGARRGRVAVLSESLYVVTASGRVHVRRCPAVARALSAIEWTEESQQPGDRKCHLCFPAVTIQRRRRS
jgi:hypothetical protein